MTTNRRLLIENFTFTPEVVEVSRTETLAEDRPTTKRSGKAGKKPPRAGMTESAILLKGKIGVVDQPTANGRTYPAKLMEAQFQRLAESMQNRSLLGECDHPADGKTKLQRVSHLVLEMKILPNGDVHGTIELLPTPMGRILESLARAGVLLGVSSRGYGSTSTNESGQEVVAEDFTLLTYDVVADPAAKGAYPKVFEEMERIAESEDDGVLDIIGEDTIQEYNRLVEESEAPPAPVVVESAPTPDAPSADEAQLAEEFIAAVVASQDTVRARLYNEALESLQSHRAARALGLLEGIKELIGDVLVEDLNPQMSTLMQEAAEGKAAIRELRVMKLVEGYENAGALVELAAPHIKANSSIETLTEEVSKIVRLVGRKSETVSISEANALRAENAKLAGLLAESKTALTSAYSTVSNLQRETTKLREESVSSGEVESLRRQLAESRSREEGMRITLESTEKKFARAISMLEGRGAQGSRAARVINEGLQGQDADRVLAEGANTPRLRTSTLDRVRRGTARPYSVTEETGEPDVWNPDQRVESRPQWFENGTPVPPVSLFESLAGVSSTEET